MLSEVAISFDEQCTVGCSTVVIDVHLYHSVTASGLVCQNWSGLVEYVAKTFWCLFSVFRVHKQHC